MIASTVYIRGQKYTATWVKSNSHPQQRGKLVQFEKNGKILWKMVDKA